jgi:hypothetical protein
MFADFHVNQQTYMRILAALVLLLSSAPVSTEAQGMGELANLALRETVRDARAHTLPASAPEPRVLLDSASFRRAFGAGANPSAALRATVQRYGFLSRAAAVQCTNTGPGARRSCRVADGAHHLYVDSLVATTGGYDVVVTTTFTETRRTLSATAFRKVRYSFSRDRGQWVMTGRAVVAQS